MAAYARQGDVILEGRLAGFIALQEHVDALKVYLTASDEVRARRVAQREGRDWRAVLELNQVRQASDARRYRAIYGYDLNDTSLYDLTLASDNQGPEALADQVLAHVVRRFGERAAHGTRG